MLKKLIILLLIISILGISYYIIFLPPQKPQDHLTLFGNVDIRQVDLSFQVAGRVEKIFFEEGDWVQPGDLVAVLDKTPFIDQVHQSSASLEAIQINYENAQSNLKRRQELVTGGGVSQEDLENSQTSLKALSANLKQAQAAQDIAKTNLFYTEIFSPSLGTILTRVREPGTVVNPTDPVYTLSISNPVWIRAFVTEPQLGQIYPNMPAKIYTDTEGGKVYEGHIGFISPVAEFTPKTVETTQLRTDLVYRLRIYADNPDQGLRQGMPVTIRLPLKVNP